MDIRSTERPKSLIAGTEGLLEQFEGYGRYLAEGHGRVVESLVDGASLPSGAAGIGIDGLADSRYRPSRALRPFAEFGFVGRTMAKFGSLADSAAGIGELAQTFAAERGRNDFASRMNVATLGKSIEVTARISATSIVGAGVCAAVATATGLAVLPVVAGAAAGIAAGYAVGKLSQGARAGYTKIFG